MKKLALNLFGLLAFVALSVSMTSCGGDDEKKDGVLTFAASSTADGVTIAKGDSVTYILTATDEEKRISKLVVYRSDLATTPVITKTGLDKETNANLVVGYRFTGVNDGEYTLRFEFQDKDNAPIPGLTASRKVTVGSAAVINTFTATMLYSPLTAGGSKTFFASSTGATYSKTEADASAATQALIDFGYFYGATSGASLHATSNYTTDAYDLASWTNKNATQFVTTTGVDFAAIATSAAIQSAFTGGTATNVSTHGDKRITGLTANQVFAFKTAAGKYGVGKVVSVTGTTGTSDGIKVDFKVQK